MSSKRTQSTKANFKDVSCASQPSTSNENGRRKERSEEREGQEQPVSLDTHLGGVLCVFYTKSPFSDFAPAPFILEGKYYPSVEHYFHIQMVYSFGLFKLAHTALQLNDAHEFRKKLRTELKAMIKTGLFDEKIFSKWKDGNAIKLMKKANRSKFDQNFHLRELLLHTGDRLLCFTAKNDKRLGVGMSEAEFLFWVKKNNLTLEDLLDFFSGVTRRPKELGWNALGCALMDVRAEYVQKTSILTEWKNAHPEKWKAPVDRKTVPLTDEEIACLKDIQNDVEMCAVRETKEGTKGFDAAPTPQSSSTIRVNQSLKPAAIPSSSASSSAQGASSQTKMATPPLCYPQQNDEEEDAVLAILDKVLSIVSLSDNSVCSIATCQTAHSTTDKANLPKSFASAPSDNAISVKILMDEKRIVVQRKNQEKRVIGSVDDKVLPPSKKSRWTGTSGPVGGGEQIAPRTIEARQSLLRRMQALRGEKPMINPYAVPSAPIVADDGGWDTLAPSQMEMESDRIEQQQQAQVVYKPQWPPRGTPYAIEKGEIPPDGVIPPPPGVDGPAYLLPLGRRDWIIRPEFPVRGRPAALPFELLPPPMCPRGVNPFFWQQRFTKPVPPGMRPDPSARLPLFPLKPVLIRAPEKDPDELRGPAWMPPENPMSGTLDKAKNFINNIKAKLAKRKMNRIEEGAAPTSRNFANDPDEEEAEAVNDSVAFSREIFPFGMEASLADLFDMGFVPPPIVGDPSAQRRNKPLTVNDWLSQFANPQAALRHFANRWIKKGRLTTTGEYEHTSDDSAEEGVDPARHVEVSFDEDDDEKYKRSIETQVVYVDTSQYDHYVKWYQKVHGFAPLPGDRESDIQMDMLRSWYQYYQHRPVEEATDEDPDLMVGAVGPEQLYAGNYGDYWALSRWKWAQWERKIGRGDGAKWLDAKQETYQDDVSMTGKPMVYVQDPDRETTDPDQIEQNAENIEQTSETDLADGSHVDMNQEIIAHSSADVISDDDNVITVLIE